MTHHARCLFVNSHKSTVYISLHMNDILDRCFLLVLVACKWPSIYNFAFGLEVFAIIFVAPHQLLHTPPPPDLHVIDHVPNHHQPVKAAWSTHGASTCTCSPLLRNAPSAWCSSKYCGKDSSKLLQVLHVPSCALFSEPPFDRFINVSLLQPLQTPA